MHSEIVKSTILVVYINFIKIAKFNYLKEVVNIPTLLKK